MTALSIDTGSTTSAAQVWVGWGDDLNRSQLDLARQLTALDIDDGDASWWMASAATQLWTVAVFVQLVVERVLTADAYGASPVLDPAAVSLLLRRAGGHVASVMPACPAWPPATFSPLGGDLGGTYGSEARSPYLLVGGSASDRGRALVLRALSDSSRDDVIRPDEFEVVGLSDGTYLVVLPGVTDLSSPDLGLSDVNRTVRDVDQFAFASSRSTALSGNGYAAMVAEALAAHGVPAGSELVIVGHSFGADTALDLAADPGFNGDGGYRVTHVVAAAYYSQPQLARVPASTEVLVLQNRADVPVIVERAGYGNVAAAVQDRIDVVDAALDGDALGVVSGVARSWFHDAGAAVDATRSALGHADDLGDILIGGATNDPARIVDGVVDLVTLEPGVTAPRHGQVVAVFEGGTAGAGHAQGNYIDYLDATDDPSVMAFLASIGATTSTSTVGVATGIDVSVPTPSR